MSKVTFRADDDLVEQLEALDVSKSEAMREALRLYLDTVGRDAGRSPSDAPGDAGGPIDELLYSMIDARIDERLAAERRRQTPTYDRSPGGASPVTINLTIDGRDGLVVDEAATERGAVRHDRRDDAYGDHGSGHEARGQGDRTRGREDRETPADAQPSGTDERKTSGADSTSQCGQCGEPLDRDHVYCPNCGEKASRRLFCDCGDEVRSDWAFCPSCGRRTPAADVLGNDSSHNHGQ